MLTDWYSTIKLLNLADSSFSYAGWGVGDNAVSHLPAVVSKYTSECETTQSDLST